MLQQHDFDDPVHATYGGYEGNPVSARSSTETSSEQFSREEPGGKIYPSLHTNQNLFLFGIAAMSMGTLIALVIVCLLFIGGSGGWVSFFVAGCILLGIAITTTNGTR